MVAMFQLIAVGPEKWHFSQWPHGFNVCTQLFVHFFLQLQLLESWELYCIPVVLDKDKRGEKFLPLPVDEKKKEDP